VRYPGKEKWLGISKGNQAETRKDTEEQLAAGYIQYRLEQCIRARFVGFRLFLLGLSAKHG
jgi:hypothetical protein